MRVNNQINHTKQIHKLGIRGNPETKMRKRIEIMGDIDKETELYDTLTNFSVDSIGLSQAKFMGEMRKRISACFFLKKNQKCSQTTQTP